MSDIIKKAAETTYYILAGILVVIKIFDRLKK